MKNKLYCPDCERDTQIAVEERIESILVKGTDLIEVTAKVASCVECGIDVFHPKLDGETLDKAFAEYERRHGKGSLGHKRLG